jgi:hypothetical protein
MKIDALITPQVIGCIGTAMQALVAEANKDAMNHIALVSVVRKSMSWVAQTTL